MTYTYDKTVKGKPGYNGASGTTPGQNGTPGTPGYYASASSNKWSSSQNTAHAYGGKGGLGGSGANYGYGLDGQGIGYAPMLPTAAAAHFGWSDGRGLGRFAGFRWDLCASRGVRGGWSLGILGGVSMWRWARR
jgi:hypothetical protein